MLPKQYRLTKESDIKKVFSKSKKLYSANFSLLVHKRIETSSPRFAFVISSKTSKKATVRNRMRRRVREVVRIYLQDEEENLSGRDMVFMFKSNNVADVSKVNSQELLEEILKLLEEASQV